ncbi:hypothetical protein BKA62DRAFT_675324 [Auriculariales sp. MPI-PUGE-AT-0066]|nr:hypothetical protein BKA62DRAFT_675324 [Auriculariales sp. MPI-PUGE-AT-0066]
MSSTSIFGFFIISNATKEAVACLTGSNSHFVCFDTVISAASEDSVPIPVRVRKWVPPSYKLLPAEAVALLFGQLCAPPNVSTSTPLFIDANKVEVVPGDPTGDHYQDSLPNYCYPTIIVTGFISGPPVTQDGGLRVHYTIVASEYIVDERKNLKFISHASVSIELDKTGSRFHSLNDLHDKLPIQVHGEIVGTSGGCVVLKTFNIVINVGSSSVLAAITELDTTAEVPVSPRKRFASVVSSPKKQVTKAPSKSKLKSTAPIVADFRGSNAVRIGETIEVENAHADEPAEQMVTGSKGKKRKL